MEVESAAVSVVAPNHVRHHKMRVRVAIVAIRNLLIHETRDLLKNKAHAFCDDGHMIGGYDRNGCRLNFYVEYSAQCLLHQWSLVSAWGG